MLSHDHGGIVGDSAQFPSVCKVFQGYLAVGSKEIPQFFNVRSQDLFRLQSQKDLMQ